MEVEEGIHLKGYEYYWTNEDDKILYELYNIDMMNIIEISKKLNIKPGIIISKLLQNKYISHRTLARGYMIYKNSNYYKSVVESNNSKKNDNNRKKEKNNNKENKIKVSTTVDKLFICIDKDDYIELQNDVNNMKKELTELKSQIKELVEMMKAVYEFEEV